MKYFSLILIFVLKSISSIGQNEIYDTIILSNYYVNSEEIEFQMSYIDLKVYKVAKDFSNAIEDNIKNCCSSKKSKYQKKFIFMTKMIDSTNFIWIFKPVSNIINPSDSYGVFFINQKPVYCFGEFYHSIFFDTLFVSTKVTTKFFEPIKIESSSEIDVFDELYIKKGVFFKDKFIINYVLSFCDNRKIRMKKRK